MQINVRFAQHIVYSLLKAPRIILSVLSFYFLIYILQHSVEVICCLDFYVFPTHCCMH